jgi:pilus assembly protein CpaF
VHLGRLRDKSRKVLEITEIAGYEDGAIRLNTLYRFEEEGQDENEKIIGTLKEQNTLIHKDKLKAAGL